MPIFSSETFLPGSVLAQITDLRVRDPKFTLRAAGKRRRRSQLAPTGKLTFVAADHPARNVTRVGDASLAMADRRDYLARLLRVLLGDTVDGVMATMDLLEELIVIHELVGEAGGPRFLDDKLLVASLNRGGLAGSAWELDDPTTGPGPKTCRTWNLDGAKFLLRVAPDDAGSLKTMLAAAEAITELNALELPMFLEPLPVFREANAWKVDRSAEAVAKLVGVASALGDSSHRLWLKLPYCERYEIVARSTTLPILLLGGESAGDARPLLREIASAHAAGSNVRGVMVGRNVLYPGLADPLQSAAAVQGLVQKNWPLDTALAALESPPTQGLDALTRWL